MRVLPLCLFLLLLVSFAAPAAAGSGQAWKIDPDHSAAHFAVDHLMLAKVRGMFPEIQGSVMFKDNTPTAFIVTVKVSSLETGVYERDKHLKSEDFFAAGKYPNMTFTGTEVEPVEGGFSLTGTLTIKGVSRKEQVLLTGFDKALEDPWNATRRGGEARFTVNRHDYGIDWSAPWSAGELVIGDMVEVIVDMELLAPE